MTSSRSLRKHVRHQIHHTSELSVSSESLLVARPSFQIAIEALHGLENAANVFHSKALLFVDGAGLSNTNSVLDLLKSQLRRLSARM